ncbi:MULTISPECIES: chemotaxis protein [Halomonadaceae]|jgi:two-component system chemotaxis response regulator CheV|uniref:Response regulator n=1 Tax=Vreelandella halophila TaxID=86177 RepID=A0A9X5B6F3_9GAMM|nr:MULTISPECIES: chemotaxis protein [Halomonas]MYL27434.1 response regulator [Halomonas utahensis]MYL74560.1 response regulator [Halomonas sp. 22501_18_FS]
MAGLLDNVDQRTRLVGRNRLELLLFRLHGRQLFAINVFKVREVIRMPKLTAIPQRHPVVEGVTHLRGTTVPVINLGAAIGMKPQEVSDDASLIITEYNRRTQAFLIGGVERILNMNWEEIESPPKTTGRGHYLTAITRHEEKLVEIIDVEKVLSEIVPYTTSLSEGLVDDEVIATAQGKRILVVDDSPVALNQARDTIEQLGIEVVTAGNGAEGLARLQAMAQNGEIDQLLMVITDAEMPEMDGYRLTTEIREDSRLKHLHVALHTSLSGDFNQAMVDRVGCDDFLSKFRPDELAELVQNYLRKVSDTNS